MNDNPDEEVTEDEEDTAAEADAADNGAADSNEPEYFELLTYDEKFTRLKSELLDKKNTLQKTKTEYNLKILLDTWRTYHLEQLDNIQELFQHIDYHKELLISDLVLINKIQELFADSTTEISLDKIKQKITNFYNKKVAIYNKNYTNLDEQFASNIENIQDLEKNLRSIAAIFKTILELANTPNLNQEKEYLLECQRLENLLLSTYGQLTILKIEQTKLPLIKQYIAAWLAAVPELLTEITEITAITDKAIFNTKITAIAEAINTDSDLIALLSTDAEQRAIYKKIATCQRLVSYRTNNADYTQVASMINVTDFVLDNNAIAAIKAKVSDKPKLNRDKILAMITSNYFKKPVEQLTELERYLVENEIMTYVIKNNKRFNSGIDGGSYTENLNLPLPELSDENRSKYHDLVELSILHYTIDASISSLNDKLIRLSMQTTDLVKKIGLTLTDLSSLSKLVIIDADKLNSLYAQIKTLSDTTYELDQSLQEHIAEIKQHGTTLLDNFEQYKINHLEAVRAVIIKELDTIKATSNHSYRTFASELSDLLDQHEKFIDKTFEYKEELIRLGKEGQLRNNN